MPKIAVVLLALSGPVWASSLVQDFSFENPALIGAGAYSYRPTGTAWYFGSVAGSGILGSDGIVAVGPGDLGFFMTATEQGNQAAFIQKANSLISQTITGLQVGQVYQTSFYAATRLDTPGSDPFFGGGEDFDVFWDGNLIGTYLPTSTVFSYYTTDHFKATSTTGVLSFVGVDSDNSCNQTPCDRTAFIDNVSIFTPEPSGNVLFFSGILLIGIFVGRDLVKTRTL